MENEQRIMLLQEAQEDLQNAIDKIESAIEGTRQQGYTKAYLVDHLKIRVDSNHGYLTNDINIDTVIEEIEEEISEEL